MASEGDQNHIRMAAHPGMSLSTSNTRKAPPLPLSISSASLSPHSHVTTSTSSAVPPPDPRKSLESSRSDLTSIRSDLISLRLGEFPSPPTVLPTIPASPLTPRSLCFSTTPNTPRSRTSSFAHNLQEPLQEAGRALLSSPRSIKGFFTRSNNSQSKFAEQQEQSLRDLIAEEKSRATEKESHTRYLDHETRPSSPGINPLPSGGRSSPAAQMNMSEGSSRSRSPLRYNSSTVAEINSPRGISLSMPSPKLSLPPRSPLPVPPSKRNSGYDSARYSQIVRQVGAVDMEIDVNEEQLLSTDFITEMLRQPALSSPASSHFLQPPSSNSPRTLVFPSFASDNLRHPSDQPETGNIPSSYVEPPSSSHSSPISKSISIEQAGSQPLTLVSDVLVPRAEEQNATGRADASPSPSDAGDIEGINSPSASPLPYSSNAQYPAIPARAILRNHQSPHPFVPSTPMSPESFTTISPGGSRTALAQVRTSPWKGSGLGQLIASHLPIGRPNPLVTSPAMDDQEMPSPKIVGPKIRQHRYPRNGSPKPSPTPKTETSDDVQMQEMPPTMGVDVAASPEMESFENVHSKHSEEHLSHATSTQTQRGSLAVLTLAETPGPLTDGGITNPRLSSYSQNSRPSDSYYHSTTSEMNGDDLTDFQIVTAVNKPAPEFVRKGSIVRPTVVGVAPAVVVQASSLMGASPASTSSQTQHQRLRDETTSPTSGIVGESSSSPPASPRNPPSVHSPPAHRTDIPESAKSARFSDDCEDMVKHGPYLPHHEVTTEHDSPSPKPQQWMMYPNPDGLSQQRGRRPSPKGENANAGAASFKSFVSYISTKSKASTVHTRKSTISSRLARLLRKPLPPLPTQVDDDGDNDKEKYASSSDHMHNVSHQHHDHRRHASIAMLEKSPYRLGKVSLPKQADPTRRVHYNLGDEVAPDDGDNKIDMLGADSVKVAKRKRIKQMSGANNPSHEGEADPTQRKFGGGIPEYDYHAHTHSRGASESGRGIRFFGRNRSKKCLWITSAVLVVAVILIIGLAVGLSLKKNSSGTTCSNGLVGSLCNLNATCTCPAGTTAGTCSAPLAQALNSLVPMTSQLFNVNITSQALALTLWKTQGTPSDCASQAKLIDVGSELDVKTSPNRTHWAQSALIWNLFETGDIGSTQLLQSSIQRFPFNSIQHPDGIVPDPHGSFRVMSSGYLFDFSNQTVMPPAITFVGDVGPSQEQLAQLNNITQSALDRMYSFASASAVQHQLALSKYWTIDLSLNINDLPAFLAAFRTSQVVLPFDASAQPLTGLLNNAINHTLAFPPPIACFPNLTNTQLSQISSVETGAFGLPAVTSSPSAFDSSCFANHPVYGSLDVLRTRLPFADARTGVAQQSVTLNASASSRAILHAGELLGALPGPPLANNSNLNVNPARFGTLSHVHHIALGWLQSFSNISLATAAAQFLASNPTGPPPSTSPLVANTTTIPTVEVAVFGVVFLSDVSLVSSSFTTPSGTLFFGLPAAETFRLWALQPQSPPSSASIVWANSTFASQVVRESAVVNNTFESIWTASQRLAAAGITNATGIQAVIQSLEHAQLFTQ